MSSSNITAELASPKPKIIVKPFVPMCYPDGVYRRSIKVFAASSGNNYSNSSYSDGDGSGHYLSIEEAEDLITRLQQSIKQSKVILLERQLEEAKIDSETL